MKKDEITINITQDFYDWWQKTPCSKNQGIMVIAWTAWKTCKAQCLKATKKPKNNQPLERVAEQDNGKS